MGIDLAWTDANGRIRDAVGDPDFHCADAVIRVRNDRSSTFPTIKTIDPYGTTRFTPPQVATLLHEMELLRESTAPVVSIALGRFLSIIRAAEAAPGTWLEFSVDRGTSAPTASRVRYTPRS